jgi:hypothetical protein
MRRRLLGALALLTLATTMTWFVPFGIAVEAQKAAAKPLATWTVPRTAWGDPDLQGIWDTSTNIPFERASGVADKATFSDEELTERQQQARKRAQENAARSPVDDPTLLNVVFEGTALRRLPSNRTSLVIDPPDGKIPPLTPEARQRLAARETARQGRGEADSWEDRHIWERCVTRTLPTAMLSIYDSNYLITQSPGYVAILMEMIHETRIIPLDGRPHVSSRVRQWMGDSRGHWEGNTLVVDTTNFNDRLDGGLLMPSHLLSIYHHRGSGETLHLVERFTRVDANSIDYRFTVDDPKTFTRSWTAAVPMRNDGTPDQIFEYACHEGNMQMANLLKGARADEAGALEAARKEADERIKAGHPGVR